MGSSVHHDVSNQECGYLGAKGAEGAKGFQSAPKWMYVELLLSGWLYRRGLSDCIYVVQLIPLHPYAPSALRYPQVACIKTFRIRNLLTILGASRDERHAYLKKKRSAENSCGVRTLRSTSQFTVCDLLLCDLLIE